MHSIDTKKVIGFSLLIVIPFLTIFSTLYLLLKEDEVKGIQVERVMSVQEPYITNLMPKIVNVNEEYIFVPRVVATDFSNVTITVQEGPEWLWVDGEGIVRGYPLIEDIGTYKVVLKVEDEVGSSTITEYVIVVDDEE
ncbi:MAG: hypothetical protein RBT33_00400 [Candidatus Dojkabacteria bacterium]|jgi:hypothetical protein|nr:hypothetical protein [Candidatus Dojkabacteria bacterium]